MWYLPFTSTDQLKDGAVVRMTFQGRKVEGRLFRSSGGLLVFLSNDRGMHDIGVNFKNVGRDYQADLRRFMAKAPSLKRYWYSTHACLPHARLVERMGNQGIRDLELGPVGRVLPNGMEVDDV